MTHYQISRNGQMYGPYTLEDLQRYVSSGNVLPSDLAKSDEMSEWIPVSQLLGSSSSEQPLAPGSTSSGFSTPGFGDPGVSDPGFAAPAATAGGFASPGYTNPAYSAPAAAFNASEFPDAPNLNWGIVLLIDFFTCGIFQYVWNIIVASWVKKVQPNATALYLYVGVVVLLVVYFVVTIPASIAQVHLAMANPGMTQKPNVIGGLIALVLWITRLVARFVQRASLEQHFNTVENVGLKLNPVMTFFFGGLYFQYHLNKINDYKQAMRMNQPPTY